MPNPGHQRQVARRALRAVLRQAGRAGWLRPVLLSANRWRMRHRSWMQPHPFDREHGIEAAGYVPGWLLGAGAGGNLGYGGCQPSCLRRALSTVPDPARHAFLDIGCGKGRGLAVASELPFRRVVGVEIDPALCRTARGNAAAVASRFPGRVPVEVMEDDAATFPIPGGDLVVFIYHAFSLDLLGRLVARLADGPQDRSLFVVYENPEFGHVLDAEPRLRRWFAETVPCDRDERGTGSGTDETVVCWTSRAQLAPSWPGAEARIGLVRGRVTLGAAR